MHDVVKLFPAGFLPLVAARINFEHIARLRREEPEQTFESVRTTGLLSTIAARKKKTEIFYNRKKRNKETSYF